MAAAFLILTGLTHNIKYLKEIIECTGAGNLNLRYQGKSGDEVDYLGKAYNKMLDDIQGYITEDKKAETNSRWENKVSSGADKSSFVI